MITVTNVCFAETIDYCDFIFAGLAIPDVSGIYPAVVKLLFSGWFVGSSDIGREFRQGSGVSTSRNLNNLESSLWWSYRTCPVFIPDVSGMHDQRPTTSFQSPEGREFRHESGVPTVGSSDIHREFCASQRHCNSVTIGSV